LHRARLEFKPKGFKKITDWGWEDLLKLVNKNDYMVNVNIRVAKTELDMIDQWVTEGRFASRSDAIRMIVAFYEEREETRKFYSMLIERSREAKEHPELLIPLEEL
jgi:Arc/MetJ-type ribon-helix-helix transcriptional regulator